MPHETLPHAPSEAAIAAQLQRQREDFVAAGPVAARVRKDRLRRCVELLKKNSDRICEVISADFGGRHPVSSLMMDVQAPISTLKYAIRHVDSWMRPQRRAGLFPFNLFGARSELHFQPKGVVGIAGTWNGPLFMLFAPLASVFAAGNRAMLKPSDLSPQTSAWLAEAVPQFFDPLELSVVTGDLTTAQAFTRQVFDHLVFTGSAGVAREIMRDAATNLVPLTLELGGKSPTVIGRSADLQLAALRIAMARTQNGGQICVMPDTVYVARECMEAFIETFSRVWTQLMPGVSGNPDLCAVANERHMQRIESNIADAASAGARVVSLGAAHPDATDRRMPLRLVVDAPLDAAISRREIFGPAMALRSYEQMPEVVQAINSGDRPLALYYFGRDHSEQEYVLGHTWSGGVCINDAMLQVGMTDVPFGGIGASGMGVYQGLEGFAEFSNLRGLYRAGWWDPRSALGLLPPYRNKLSAMLRDGVRRS